jgi:hypothetical protein
MGWLNDRLMVPASIRAVPVAPSSAVTLTSHGIGHAPAPVDDEVDRELLAVRERELAGDGIPLGSPVTVRVRA